jgi:hypothetical protein
MTLTDDLRTALHDGAAQVRPAPDSAGLGAALTAAEHRRRVRTVTGVALLAGTLVAGVVAAAGALGEDQGSIGTAPVGTHAVAPVPTSSAEPSTVPSTVPPAPEPPIATDIPKVVVPPLSKPEPVSVPADKPADPPPTTTKPSAQPAPLTATAAYGSCGEDPPYDDYSGTATPGALVKIVSPYSSPATTTADADGHWALRVYFPNAPVGTTFSVTVGSPGATSVTLSFTRLAAP